MHKKSLKVFSFLLLLISFERAVMAADEKENPGIALSDEITGKFAELGFSMINPDLVAPAILEIPEQSELWSCGKHAAGHCLKIKQGSDCPQLNYKMPENYPLSVKACITPGIEQTLRNFSVSLPTDKENNFRVGPLPCQMEDYLKTYLGHEAPVFAVSHNEQPDGFAAFSDSVQQSIDKDLPVIAWYVIDAKAKMMHFYTVIGYKTEGNNLVEVAVLDSKGNGLERIKTFKAVEFFQNLNAESIVDLVKMLNSPIIRAFVESIVGPNGFAKSPEISSWMNFSYLTFIPPREDLRCVVKPQQQQGCAQQ